MPYKPGLMLTRDNVDEEIFGGNMNNNNIIIINFREINE